MELIITGVAMWLAMKTKSYFFGFLFFAAALIIIARSFGG